jgi:hypothetical protein
MWRSALPYRSMSFVAFCCPLISALIAALYIATYSKGNSAVVPNFVAQLSVTAVPAVGLLLSLALLSTRRREVRDVALVSLVFNVLWSLTLCWWFVTR